MYSSNTYIVLCTETHLDPSIKDCEFLPRDFITEQNIKNMSTDWERHNTTFKEYKKECKAAHDKYLNDNVFNDEANAKKFYI